MARTRRAQETTLEDVIQTTTHMSAENVVVTVSIPANVAETHVINISIIPRANRPVEVRTERIAVNYQTQSGDEVGLQPQMSRLDLNEEPQTPGRRNTTVSFDTPTSTGRSHSARTPANTPASLTGVRSPQWAAAVDVSDDDTEVDELMPVYPPLHGQREVAHRDQLDGRRYYVLTKGKKIGVFYCTWNEIAPYAMTNQGGEYTKQKSFTLAKDCWNATPRRDRQIIGN